MTNDQLAKHSATWMIAATIGLWITIATDTRGPLAAAALTCYLLAAAAFATAGIISMIGRRRARPQDEDNR